MIAAVRAVALSAADTVTAQQPLQSIPLSAQASDPKMMGWTPEFPPPADKAIHDTDDGFFAFPKLR